MSADLIEFGYTQTAMPLGSVPFTVAARRLRLTRPQLLELVLEGRLKASRHGNSWMADGEDVAALEAALPPLPEGYGANIPLTAMERLDPAPALVI